MDINGHNKHKQAAVLEEIVLEKLRMKSDLSKDEQWFYLTKILRVSEDDAEKILNKVASSGN